MTATGRSSDDLVEVAVTEILRRKPIDGLQEIKVVKDGQVVPFYPFTS